MNFYDILLGRQLCCDKTEYETLVVTENGEYSAPQGKAWNKVVVETSGGECDFSIVPVTIVNDLSEQFESYLPIIVTVPGVGDVLDTLVYVPSGLSETISCVLYKGESLLPTFSYEVTLDGDAELVLGGVTIKGDCTITLTDSQEM